MVNKKHKPIENVFDDCGEDVSKLEQSMCYSDFDDCLSCNPDFLETYEVSDSDDEPIEHEVNKMIMVGQVFNGPTSFMLTQVIAEGIEQMVLIANTRGSGVDLSLIHI